jgi:NTP pyrophosphatase (non-canonical NTP hydrolase)
MRTYKQETSLYMVIAKGAMCIAGEAGELANIVKKVLWHGHDFDTDKMVDELGDILWYLATTAHGLGYDLDTIAERNIQKLKQRYPDGFSEERSKNRNE